MEIHEINSAISGNNYVICFIEPYKKCEKIIYGEIQNFNPSGNVVFYDKKYFNLYIIPYSSIKWMLPNGLSMQYSELIQNK